MLTRILLDPQGGEGNGNNANGDTSKADIATMATGLLQKQGGDPIKVISKLLKENHQYREQIRDTKAKVPVEGSIVLTGDEAKRYQAYRSLGDDPKAIKDALTAGQAAIEERDGLVREKTYAEAAPLGGYKVDAFVELAKRDKLNITVKNARGKDGKDALTPFVVDADGKEIPLAEHVNAKWAPFKESLGGSDAGKPAGIPGRANDNTPAPRPGTGTPDAMAVYLKAQGQPGI